MHKLPTLASAILSLACVALAGPNWDMSGTSYEATLTYTFTTSPFPLSDTDTKSGPLIFGTQDEGGNVDVVLTLPVGDAVFPIQCTGVVDGDFIHVYTPEPVPGPFSYRTSFRIGPIECILDVVATNVVVNMNVHVLDAYTIDWGQGTVDCDLRITSPNCYIPYIDRGHVDIHEFTAVGGPAKRFVNLSGVATLQSYAGSLTTKDLKLSLLGPSPTEVNLSMDLSGAWSARVALVPGTYTPRFSSQYYLRKSLKPLILTGDASGLNAYLLGGDADSSNSVSLSDLNILLLAFGRSEPDLDGSGRVDLGDLNLVLINFAAVGD